MQKSRYHAKAKSVVVADSSLFFPDDEPEIYELIKELIARKRFIQRPSKYHLKHRKVNYFPSTEVITIDGQGRHPLTGPDAFLELLDQLYPRRRPAIHDPLERDLDEPPAPSGLICEMSLDDEEYPTASNDNKADADNVF